MSSEERDDLVFKALADSRRREILDLLASRARTTGELCAHFPGLDRCTVMQHIAVLERADLVISRREGRLRWNHLNVLPIKKIHDRWISPYAAAAVDLLTRLKRDVESRGSRPPAARRRRRRAAPAGARGAPRKR